MPTPSTVTITLHLCVCGQCDLDPELVAAEPLGGDQYRIAQVPAYSAQVGLGDRVLALTGPDGLEFLALVERVCVGSFSFELGRGHRPSVVRAEIEAVGAAVRRGDHRWFTVNAASADQVDDLVDLLARHRIVARYCDHQTGHWHDVRFPPRRAAG